MPKFKIGDAVISKKLGCIGLVLEDPIEPEYLIVRIHPFIYGRLNEEEWELYQV